MVMKKGLKNSRKVKYKGKHKWILSVESNDNNILHSVKKHDLKCYQNRNK